MQSLLQRFLDLPARQQLLLLAALLLGVLWILVQLVWRPLATGSARLEASIAQEREDLAWMRGAAERIRSLQADTADAPGGDDSALNTVINRAAQQAGFVVNRLTPRGRTEATVVLDSVPFEQVLRWLYLLEGEQGVTARSLTVSGTNEAGRVNVQTQLQRD
jgi:general secretion pathway protein M